MREGSLHRAQSESAFRILVIDDDQPTRVLLSAIFAGSDVVVHAVADGETALVALRHENYDAILLDLMLPRENGFAIIRELKSRQPELLAKIVIVTGASEQTLRDFEDGARVRKILRKPIDILALRAEILACRPAVVPPVAPLRELVN